MLHLQHVLQVAEPVPDVELAGRAVAGQCALLGHTVRHSKVVGTVPFIIAQGTPRGGRSAPGHMARRTAGARCGRSTSRWGRRSASTIGSRNTNGDEDHERVALDAVPAPNHSLGRKSGHDARAVKRRDRDEVEEHQHEVCLGEHVPDDVERGAETRRHAHDRRPPATRDAAPNNASARLAEGPAKPTMTSPWRRFLKYIGLYGTGLA